MQDKKLMVGMFGEMKYNTMRYIILSIILPLFALGFLSPEHSGVLSGGVAPDYIKQAHRYHGIRYSYLKAGVWVFDRDGHVCKLLR